MQELLRYIHTFSEFSTESWNVLVPILSEVNFKKGEDLVKIHETCSSLYFITKGYCRAFNVQDGVEVNTSFYFENDTATHMNSYIFGSRATCSIQACEPLTAIKFNKQEVLEVSKKAPEIELIAKRNLQRIAAKQEKQLELYRLLSAGERYHYMEQNHPDMLQRVPLTLLASYLGVKRETLSRIRKKNLHRL